MEAPDRTLLLIHEDEVRVRNFKALDSKSRKRRASEELDTRPRKLHIVDPYCNTGIADLMRLA